VQFGRENKPVKRNLTGEKLSFTCQSMFCYKEDMPLCHWLDDRKEIHEGFPRVPGVTCYRLVDKT